jgi:hypothetical protein
VFGGVAKITCLFATDTDESSMKRSFSSSGPPTVERGVSVDQDGKSNVWAIGMYLPLLLLNDLSPCTHLYSINTHQNTHSLIHLTHLYFK